MDSFLGPDQVMQALSDTGVKKVARTLPHTLVSAMLAGVYIGFASQLAMVAGTGDIPWSGLRSLLMGAVFSVGLMFVMIPGAELFTGNTLIVVPLLERRVTLRGMLRNWSVVYAGNFLGAVALSLLVTYGAGMFSGGVGMTLIETSISKVSHTWSETLARGIGANWLVCLAVWFALASRSLEGKILGIFFPVMAFVAMGYEHSVANMFILTSAKMALPLHGLLPEVLPWSGILMNLLFSTIGNIIGGGFFVGTAYWYLYGKETKQGA